MATFSAQVVDLVGTFSDEAALDSFITEGANEVINAMPRSMLERIAEETAVTDGTTTSEGHKVLHMLRNDGTIDQPCRAIPARKRGRVQDSSDMEFATTSDPVYWVQDGKFNLFPNGNGLLVSVPTYNQGSPLDASAISTITNFPNEAEYLVVLYAAIKALQQNLSGLVEADFSISATAPTAPSLATLSGGTVSPITVASVSKADISGDVPSYTAPVVSGDTQEITGSIVAGSTGTAADRLNFQHWYDVLADMIEDSEDTELASIQLQKINSYIQAYQTATQNQINIFNKNNARYQANVQAELAKHNSDLQKVLRQAQLDGSDAQQESAQTLQAAIQNNDDLVQKFLAELNKYTAQVNSEVQTYSQNISNNAQKFQHTVAQQGKLQADYDKGIQVMRGG